MIEPSIEHVPMGGVDGRPGPGSSMLRTQPPSTCPPEDQLLAVIRGRATAADLERVERHLEQCGPCRQRIDALARQPGAPAGATAESPAASDGGGAEPGERVGSPLSPTWRKAIARAQ